MEKLLESSTFTTNSFGSLIWEDLSGNFHRENGPAVTYPDGSRKWYLHAKLIKREKP